MRRSCLLFGVFSEDEFLDECVGYPAARVDKGAVEHQARTSIAVRKIRIGQRAGGEIASNTRDIELQVPVVSSADEGARDSMQRAGFPRTFTLVEVARILMKERGVHGSAEHYIRKALGIGGAKTLGVT